MHSLALELGVEILSPFSSSILEDMGCIPPARALLASIDSRGVRFPYFRAIQNEDVLRDISLSPTSQAAREALTQGSTLTFQFVDAHFLEFARLIRHFKQRLRRRCQVSAYVSPSGSRAFPAHIDHYDAIILQIEGSKTWRFWEGLPESLDPAQAGRFLAPTRELHLKAGEALLVPARTVHHVLAETEDSYHLTVGVHEEECA